MVILFFLASAILVLSVWRPARAMFWQPAPVRPRGRLPDGLRRPMLARMLLYPANQE